MRVKTCLMGLLLVFSSAAAQVHAQAGAADAPAQRALRDSTSTTGSIIRKQAGWNNKIPLNKTYAELTPEQKGYFHAMYESIPPGDEPPFPLKGMKPIVSAILKGQAQRVAKGELRMAVTVGADGKGQKVEVYGGVDDPELLKFAATVLLMTRYKPAVCSGQPCTMQFPFSLHLQGGY